MEELVDIVLKCMIVFSAVLIFICFIRALMGPSIADRLVAINMIGTQIIIIIAELTVLLKEAWLADVASVYELLSFLGIVVLTKIYIGIYRKEHPDVLRTGEVKGEVKKEVVEKKRKGKKAK